MDMSFPVGGGVPLFWSTYIHIHDRLDKPCSALGEARLKTKNKLIDANILKSFGKVSACIPHVSTLFWWFSYQLSGASLFIQVVSWM